MYRYCKDWRTIIQSTNIQCVYNIRVITYRTKNVDIAGEQKTCHLCYGLKYLMTSVF